MQHDQSFGAAAERHAEQFLVEQGYEILARNYRKSWGELDIIARDNDVVVCVEVKASRELHVGFEPELRAIQPQKLRRIIRTGRTFLASRAFSAEQAWRIDVIAVILSQDGNVSSIEHFKNIDIP